MDLPSVRFVGVFVVSVLSVCGTNGRELPRALAKPPDAAAVRIGERLFSEQRFAQFFRAWVGEDVNVVLPSGDPGLSGLATRAGGTAGFPGTAMSCRACHFSDELRIAGNGAVRSVSAFADHAQRSAVPRRDDGRSTVPRNSPSLVDALTLPSDLGLLHFDGEFASPEALVKETWLGRNFGWLPGERADALRHLARVVRGDDGVSVREVRRPVAEGGRASEHANHSTDLSYAALFRGSDAAMPPAWRLSEPLRIDVGRATDEEILDAGASHIVAFLRSLQFERDEAGQHKGSPYDAFLAANRMPRAPARDQTLAEYGRQIGEQIAALRAPRFIDEATRGFRFHEQPFRFGELELRGMRIFFRGAVGNAQKGGAGNCAECHVPPHFSDFKFHNTGAAQEEYDALHGAGAFERLMVPGLDARTAAFDRWLPPTERHPAALGPLLRPAAVEAPERTDLGLWNVYGNPDLPAPQAALERMFNPAGQLTRDDVLARTLARFKTSTVRDLGQSPPYLHTGESGSIEEVVLFYQRMSSLAHAGRMRNAPPEFFAMRLAPDDVAPLSAFLRALNEDYEERR